MIQLWHLHVLLANMAVMIVYVQRVNMSVAIVAMTDAKRTDTSKHEVYHWDEAEKAAVLSSFFGGYIMLQVVAGRMAENYGAKWILVVAMFLSSLATAIVPHIVGYGYQVVCAVRIFMGAVQGAFYPSIMVMLSKWIPLAERSRVLTLTYSAGILGPFVGFILSGYLAATRFGWPLIFYVTGGIGFCWMFLWLFIGASSPRQHVFISKTELQHLEESLTCVSHCKKTQRAPWKDILTSAPVWAIVASHVGLGWSNWVILAGMPNFINSILDIDIGTNGVLSALPHLCGYLAAVAFSLVSYHVQRKNYVSRTIERKIWNTIALWGGGITIFVIGIWNTRDSRIIIPLFILTVVLDSALYSGFFTNHVDLSPNYCGTIMGISNSWCSATSLLTLMVIGWIVNDPTSRTQWRNEFVLTTAVKFGTNLIYVIFGSAEKQSWDGQSNSNLKL